MKFNHITHNYAVQSPGKTCLLRVDNRPQLDCFEPCEYPAEK